MAENRLTPKDADLALLDLQSMYRAGTAKRFTLPSLLDGRLKGQRDSSGVIPEYKTINIVFSPSDFVSVKLTKLCEAQVGKDVPEQDRNFFFKVGQTMRDRNFHDGLDIVLTQGEIDRVNTAWITKLMSSGAKEDDRFAFFQFNQEIIDAGGKSRIFERFEQWIAERIE